MRSAIIPRWSSTIGDILTAREGEFPKAIIKRRCSRCDTFERVSLELLAQELGADQSLWDHRPPCPACGDAMFFLYSPSRTTPMRPMLT